MALTPALDFPATADRCRFDFDRQCLIGSRCADCGTVSWPSRAICHRCGEPRMQETVFSRAGSLSTYTTVHVPREGLEVPYTLGQVKLDDGPMVFGHVRGLAAGVAVPVRVGLRLASDNAMFPPFWFEPEEGDA